MNTATITEAIRAGHTCLRVVTWEEAEARQAIFEAGVRAGMAQWTWSATQGLSRGPLAAPEVIPSTMNPGAALVYLRENLQEPSLPLLLDLAPHFSDPLVVRAFRELVEQVRMGMPAKSCVVMLDCKEEVPEVVDLLSYRVPAQLPTDEQIDGLVRRTVQNIRLDVPLTISMSKRDLADIVVSLRGLTSRQIEDAVRSAALEDRAFTAADLPRLLQAKRERVRSVGVLEFLDSPASLDDIGGLGRLKTWLSRRANSFGEEAHAFGLVAPRGVLLLGVQGGGKSLAAKAISTAWRRPLVRLDPGALFDRYIGESERRLRDALGQAEAMAPCVLWIDEIEKGFASAASRSTDGGLSQRMFGTLLTWMQERTSPVFMVATANDIEALPPELLRKGRFDEIFFVDLPDDAARKCIWEIHLRKRKIEPAAVGLDALVAATAGYSGSEIEQAVMGALHDAFSTRCAMTTELLLKAVRESPPLSVTMAEDIEQLRSWAKNRCVPAD